MDFVVWFSTWICWVLFCLPLCSSKKEIIDNDILKSTSFQHFNVKGKGEGWSFITDEQHVKTCGVGSSADFWFVTKYVDLSSSYADVIYVDVEAGFTLCNNPGTGKNVPCFSNYFEVYINRGKDKPDVNQDNLLDLFSPVYNITNNTLPSTTLSKQTQTFSFNPNDTKRVTFAVRSRGACGKILKMIMYYYYCKETYINSVRLKRTASPMSGSKLVTANCSKNSLASSNITRLEGYCYSNGSWNINNDFKCLCIEGHEFNAKSGCSRCSNTSYKKNISNDNCTECPMNTVSNINRTSCVCKDGYYKSSSDKSELSPCYALPVISKRPRVRFIAYGVALSWTTPSNSLNETILYNVRCFICNQSICNILCRNETYDPSPNNSSLTRVTVSNLIAGERYIFRVYARNSLNDAVPEDEWDYTETDPVQVISDSGKGKTDDPTDYSTDHSTDDSTDDSSRIINFIIATTVAGVFLSIMLIVLLVKYKRVKRALKLSTPLDIQLQAVETPQESLPIDQEEPGYETVSAVVREFHEDVATSANNSEDTSAEGLYEEVGVPSNAQKTSGYETPGEIEVYEEPEISSENPGYAELDKNRLQCRNTTDDSTYQKLQRRDSDDVIPAHERRESYEDIKMGRNLPGYEELDQSKREADDYTPLSKSAQKPELA